MEYTAPADNTEIGKEQIVATCRSGVFFSFVVRAVTPVNPCFESQSGTFA